MFSFALGGGIANICLVAVRHHGITDAEKCDRSGLSFAAGKNTFGRLAIALAKGRRQGGSQSAALGERVFNDCDQLELHRRQLLNFVGVSSQLRTQAEAP